MRVLETEPRPLQEQQVLLALEHLPRPPSFPFQHLSLARSLPTKLGRLASGSQPAFSLCLPGAGIANIVCTCVYACAHMHGNQGLMSVISLIILHLIGVHMFICVCMFVCVYVCADQRLMLGVLIILYPYFFQRGSLNEPRVHPLSRLTSQSPSSLRQPSPPPVLAIQALTATRFFYRFWETELSFSSLCSNPFPGCPLPSLFGVLFSEPYHFQLFFLFCSRAPFK